jgi:hypothetical protein
MLLISIVLMAAVLLLAACGSTPAGDSAPAGSAGSASTMDESSSDTSMEMAAGGVDSQGTGFCSNAFFPLRSDKTWTYKTTTGDSDYDFNWTFKDITDSSFTIVQNFPSLTNEISWQCGPDGMLSSTYANLAMNSDVNVKYDTLSVTGVALPPADEWVMGKSWDMDYVVGVTLETEGMTIEASGDIVTTRTITAIESVTVPAGTYANAYRVDSTGQMTLDMMGNQSTTPLTYSDWYVKGVGLVKSSSAQDQLTYDMQLISFE